MEVAARTWLKTGRPALGPLLALDASTDRAVVALSKAPGDCRVASPGSSRQHGRGLVASIRDLLDEGGVRPGDLVGVGVGLGPGSFTGLRIAVMAAKTLAYAAGCPVVGLDSLEAIARNAADSDQSVHVVGDAQRGDLFVAEFGREGPGSPIRRLGSDRLENAVDFARSLPAGGVVLGPNLGRTEPSWPESVGRGPAEVGSPTGQTLVAMLREALARDEPFDPWSLEPIYARRSAAEEKAGPVPEHRGGPAA